MEFFKGDPEMAWLTADTAMSMKVLLDTKDSSTGKKESPEQTGVHGVYRVDPDGTIARILTEPEVMRPPINMPWESISDQVRKGRR